jgi:hypothetical protein
MTVLAGIYTPDVDIVPLSGAVTVVRQADPTAPSDLAHRGQVCVAAIDVTGNGGNATLQVNLGTWSGSVFTPLQVLATVAALSGETEQIFVLALVDITEAIQIVTTGSAVGFVRIQGLTKQVSP